ncbi:hypothetical protein BXY51_006585 [Actinoplanes cyaneus]|nr:hypothetical protein [Actinoplanes cyaneus]
MLAAGSSQAARVNESASQVNDDGSSRRWISAASVNGVVRCPHSNRSVCRRFAMMTKASVCAVRDTAGAAGHRRHGVDRRGLFHLEQHVAQIHTAGPAVDHATQHRADAPPALPPTWRGEPSR